MSTRSTLPDNPLSALKAALERLKAALLTSPVKLADTISLVLTICSAIENVTSNRGAWTDLAAYISDVALQLVEEAAHERGPGGNNLKDAQSKVETEFRKILDAATSESHESKKGRLQRFSLKSEHQRVSELKKRLDRSLPVKGLKRASVGHLVPSPTDIENRLISLTHKVDEVTTKLQQNTEPVVPESTSQTREDSQTSELWEAALIQYQTDTGCDPKDDSSCRDSADIVRRLVLETEGDFEAYRKKSEALRKAITPILDIAQAASDVLKDSQTPTAPVASVVSAAVKFLLRAIRRSLDDYDIAVAIFRELHGFMERFDVYRQHTIPASLYPVVVEFFAELLKTLGVITRWMTGGSLRKSLQSLRADSDIKSCMEALGRLSKREHTMVAVNTLHGVSTLLQKQESAEVANHVKHIRKWLSAPLPYASQEKHSRRHYGTTGSWFLNGTQYSTWRQTPGSLLWLQGKSGSGKTILTSAVIESLQTRIKQEPSAAVLYFYFDFNESSSLSYSGLLSSLVSQLLSRCQRVPSSLGELYRACDDGVRSPKAEDLVRILYDMLDSLSYAYLILDGIDETETVGEDGRASLLALVQKLLGDSKLPESKLATLHLFISSRQEPDITKALQPFHPQVVALHSSTVNNDIDEYLTAVLALDPAFESLRSDLKTYIKDVLLGKANGMFRWIDCQVETLKSCECEQEIEDTLKELPEGLDATYHQYLRRIPKKRQSQAQRVLTFLAFSTRYLTLEELGELRAVNLEPDDKPRFNPKLIPLELESVLSLCSGLITIVSSIEFDPPDDIYSSLTSRAYATDRDEVIRVGLAHLSVKEYLLSDMLRDQAPPPLPSQVDIRKFHISALSANLLIARICLNYLLRFGESTSVISEGQSPDRTMQHTVLMSYAVVNWPKHVQNSNAEATIQRELLKLFEPHSRQFANWSKHYHGDWPPSCLSGLSQCWLYHAAELGLYHTVQKLLENETDINASITYNPSVLRIAAVHGHHQIVDILVSSGVDVNANYQTYGAALHAACAEGHEAVVQVLLEHGAELNSSGGYYVGTPLVAAASRGHEKIVRMLLRSGASVNAQGEERRTALKGAAARGSETLVQILLKSGADVNAQGGRDGTALQLASVGGHLAVVRILLEHGADVNVRSEDSDYGTALVAALANGHLTVGRLLLARGANANTDATLHITAVQAAARLGEESLVRELIDRGADVNATGGTYGSAVEEALCNGHEAVVGLLLDNGADVDPELYGTALQAVSSWGYEALVRELLDQGADVNMQGGEYATALQAASSSGYEAVVYALLKRGAHVNIQGGYHGTALHAASAEGHYAVVQLLLLHGADVNVRTERHETALQKALDEKHFAVAQLLLESEADPNAGGGHNGTPLQAASYAGNESLVQELLSRGAAVNSLGGYYGTALQAASHEGHKSVVQLLLESGADVNAQGGGQYGTALQAASKQGHEIVVQSLLKSGANVNIQDGHYGTALQAASHGGHTELVRILLDRGADVNANVGEYGSALQAATSAGHTAVVRLLLEADADVDLQGNRGTALTSAAFDGDEELVRELLERGAYVDAQTWGQPSALQAASQVGKEEVVRVLLESGADVNAEGGYNWTALQAASFNGHEAVVRLLLQAGAEVNAEYNGGSALQAAMDGGHASVVRLLLENGARENEDSTPLRVPVIDLGGGLRIMGGQGMMNMIRLQRWWARPAASDGSNDKLSDQVSEGGTGSQEEIESDEGRFSEGSQSEEQQDGGEGGEREDDREQPSDIHALVDMESDN